MRPAENDEIGMSAPTTTAALIVAAGRGTRAGTGNLPKQFQPLDGKAMLAHTLDAFLNHDAIDVVQVVIGSDDATQYHAVAPHTKKLLPPAIGGATRQRSVFAGLGALSRHAPTNVLIHDAARPFASAELISRVANALSEEEAVIPALPITATLKAVNELGVIASTVSRDGLHAAETPQGFRFSTILAAHEKTATERIDFTDDAAVAEWAGIPVHVVPGDPANVKLTSAADILAADRRLRTEAVLASGETRVGIGYDIHPLGAGTQVILAGVTIPHNRGLIGHSDADVGLHALTDALLGALADGDIGTHFPPSDPKWKGASSDRFLADAARRVAARGGVIAHLNLVFIAELPKIGPHRDAMRRRIAEICGIAIDRVAIQATTNEGLGFIGRGEGIAAHASATIRLPYGI
jgi:2-C-methyl-D-erythritol 4-phosphate cytidylyltransferase/2-C-methyl-D-erythritol 2,4-cyclodiphosphate synthase